MARLDRLERVTDLLLVLLDAPRPLSLREIADRVPGYPESHEARRQAFERDKRLLREEGVPVQVEPVDGVDQLGYRVDPDTYYLPDLGLGPAEEAALALAVAGVHLGEPSGAEALSKLGASGEPAGPDGLSAPMVDLPSSAALPALPVVFDASRQSATVSFHYHGSSRTVSVSDVRFRRGHWYLTGYDRDAGQARTYRIDRMESMPTVGDAGSASFPEGWDPAMAASSREPWQFGAGDVAEVELLVDRAEAGRVAAELGESAISERLADGSLRVRLAVSDVGALVTWVLDLLDHAEVVGPPEVRAAVVERLRSIAAAPMGKAGPMEKAGPPGTVPGENSGTGSARSVPDGPAAAAGVAASAADDSRPAGAAPIAGRPPDTAGRLRRLLAMLAWLAEVGEAPVDEVASRFGLDPAALVAELELAACCGLPPYTPDQLMEIVVTDTTVSARLGPSLARPRRLSARQGFALAAAGRALLAVPGSDSGGALSGALSKLEDALGLRGLEVELDAPPLLDVVRRAVREGDRLEILYYSASSDRLGRREIDPRRVFASEGHWYLDAYCHLSGGVRRFRVDRIDEARPVGRTGGTAGAATGGRDADRAAIRGDEGAESADLSGTDPAGRAFAPFVPGPETRIVRIVVEPDASWMVETLPAAASTERPDGRIEVDLAVGGDAWLERLLLRLGRRGTVVFPPADRSLAAAAAARVLARYRELEKQ